MAQARPVVEILHVDDEIEFPPGPLSLKKEISLALGADEYGSMENFLAVATLLPINHIYIQLELLEVLHRNLPVDATNLIQEYTNIPQGQGDQLEFYDLLLGLLQRNMLNSCEKIVRGALANLLRVI